MPTPLPLKEVVLPSGKFASVHGLTGADILWLRDPSNAAFDASFLLMTRCAKIDDEAITYQDVLAMDARDVMCLQKEVNEYISGPVKSATDKTAK